MGAIAFSGKDEIFTKRPLTLFGDAQIGRNAKFLLTLVFNKKSPTVQEGNCGATGFMGFAFRRLQ